MSNRYASSPLATAVRCTCPSTCVRVWFERLRLWHCVEHIHIRSRTRASHQHAGEYMGGRLGSVAHEQRRSGG